MILSGSNFGDYLIDAHHIIEYSGLILILSLGAITRVGTLVPFGYFIGKAYPEVIKDSFYMLLLFIVIASFPMLIIIFLKVKSHEPNFRNS